MLAINQPYPLVLALAALIPAILAVLVLKQRPNLGARSFSVTMAAVSLWAFVSLFEVCSEDIQTKVFSYQIKYLFIVMVPLSWLVFSLYYSNRLRKLSGFYLCLGLVVPVVTVLLVATNPSHRLMFTEFDVIDIHGHKLLYPHFGPMFWFHAVYSYILLIIGFAYLSKHLIDSPAYYRHQATFLLVGGVAPWLSNIAFIFEIGPLSYYDFTPVVFSISGVIFMLGILRYKLLDIIPIARDLVIQEMTDGVIVVDDNENIIDLNQTARRLSGIKAEQVIGTAAERIIPWWPSLKKYATREKEAGPPLLEIAEGDRVRLLELSQSALRNRDKILGTLLTLRDVTAAKLAEKAVGESQERFKALSENAPVIIFSLDETGRLNYANPTWRKLLGHSRTEVMGRPLTDFVRAEHIRAMDSTFEGLIDGRMPTAQCDLHMAHKDGTRRLFDTSASANVDPEGRVTGIIGLAKDITEEKRLEQQLFQSQKMEAIGTLSGGIAHDFNNLLMGIQANLSLMRLETAQTGSLDEKYRRIEDQIQCGAALTRQLLGYTHKDKYKVTVFDLNGLVEETLNVVHRTNKNIVIDARLHEKETYICADQGQMELVLLNLFLNAVDAMPNGGALTVTSTIVNSPGNGKNVRPSKNSRYIQLTIEDTGTGMDKATQDRIYEPFFTTKEMGRGTGLGLSSVYGIVNDHSGHIDVESEPGTGTVFVLNLPNVSTLDETCAMETVASDPPEMMGNVLLIDDEPLILKYTHEMISSLGMMVSSTEDADEAVRIYQDHWETIDLVVLDLVMPKKDGTQLFMDLESINPDVRVIVTTGYSGDNRISELSEPGRHHFLKKPYNRDDMAAAIAGLLKVERPHSKNGAPQTS